ncbi:MAG: hypothetical protein DRN21_03975 [Thermoplasmata archaeon]|nr:MAG: hypothetical protein DRN21_03975 [Thermoplasmata archaeon]
MYFQKECRRTSKIVDYSLLDVQEERPRTMNLVLICQQDLTSGHFCDLLLYKFWGNTLDPFQTVYWSQLKTLKAKT